MGYSLAPALRFENNSSEKVGGGIAIKYDARTVEFNFRTLLLVVKTVSENEKLPLPLVLNLRASAGVRASGLVTRTLKPHLKVSHVIVRKLL